jgi:hypothetical protein
MRATPPHRFRLPDSSSSLSLCIVVGRCIVVGAAMGDLLTDSRFG